METTQQITKIIKENLEKFSRDEKAQAYVRAQEKFEKLVDKGVIEKRGNQLMPFDKAHLNRCEFNTEVGE